jgi:4-azaleucine resistance transporter AzlC
MSAHAEPAQPAATATFTLAGVRQGFALTVPTLPGTIVFGMAFGAAASAKGLSLVEAAAMSAFVYAGMSQMVALEAWQATWTGSTALGVMMLTAVVNSRMMLMGAAIHPWLSGYSHRFNAAQLFLLTDANWIIGTRYHADGGRDAGILVGVGLALWLVWVGVTIPGYLLGALVTDPRAFALDLVMPIFFTVMLVPLWRGQRAAAPWAIAGVTALIAARLLPGHLFILVGALSGMLAGALIPPASGKGAAR